MMLEKKFCLIEKKATIFSELVGGVTTFMTMAYIIFVQPAILSKTGMDFGSVMVATCLASAFGTVLMGLIANYPIALAPAMGHNFYFVFIICLSMSVPWTVALGINFISALIFVFLSLFGFREKIINIVPDSLKSAIAAGIGLLIALIGLEWSGIVVSQPGTIVGLGKLNQPATLVSLFGLGIISLLLVWRIKGAILLGILLTTLIGLPLGLTKYQGVIGLPPSLSPTFLKLDVLGALNFKYWDAIFVLFFLALFDSIGTLIGIGRQGGFLVEGKLPRAKQALFSDAFSTVIGTSLGTSTVTAYIESASGVAQGAKTGLANLFTGILFLIALFFYPLIKMIGGGLVLGGTTLYPAIAPALIIVGSFMAVCVTDIHWDDYVESIPAFLALIIIPLTFSITDGISFGFISFSFLKIISGRWRDVHWLIYLFSFFFILRYLYL